MWRSVTNCSQDGQDFTELSHISLQLFFSSTVLSILIFVKQKQPQTMIYPYLSYLFTYLVSLYVIFLFYYFLSEMCD